MRDRCAKPGTICVSVILSGNHGMSRLHVCVDHMMLPSSTIGNSATLMLTVGNPFMRKWEEAPESVSVYFTRCTSYFVLNITVTLADCCSLLLATIFFRMSPLVLYLGLLASFSSLHFTRSFILHFCFATVLLVDLPPQGNACCGMNISFGISVLAFLTLLLFSTSVLSCVDVVPSSDTRLLTHSE